MREWLNVNKTIKLNLLSDEAEAEAVADAENRVMRKYILEEPQKQLRVSVRHIPGAAVNLPVRLILPDTFGVPSFTK